MRKKLLIIILVLVVVVGGLAVAWSLFGGGKEESAKPAGASKTDNKKVVLPKIPTKVETAAPKLACQLLDAKTVAKTIGFNGELKAAQSVVSGEVKATVKLDTCTYAGGSQKAVITLRQYQTKRLLSDNLAAIKAETPATDSKGTQTASVAVFDGATVNRQQSQRLLDAVMDKLQ